MKAPAISTTAIAVIAGVAGLGVLGLYIWSKGGIAKAAGAAAGAAVDVAGEAASGAVGAIGASVGLPTPDDTTTDAAVARWIIDYPTGGYWVASAWAGVPALTKALLMDAGSGRPPPVGSALYARFPPLPQASYDETDRLLARYPAPREVDTGFSLGSWLYDMTHEAYDPNAPTNTGGASGSW